MLYLVGNFIFMILSTFAVRPDPHEKIRYNFEKFGYNFKLSILIFNAFTITTCSFYNFILLINSICFYLVYDEKWEDV